MKIQINQKYKNLLSIPKEEYNILKQSIKECGQLQPIVINSEGVILDGHLRYKVCSELNIEPKFLTKQFDNILLEKQYVIKSNLSRRNLNNYQKAKLAYLLEPIEKELAKQRMLAGKPSAKIGVGSKGETRDKISDTVGISHTTYDNAKYVMEHGSKELQDDCELGKLSVNKACTILKQDTKEYRIHQLKAEEGKIKYQRLLMAEFLNFKHIKEFKIELVKFTNWTQKQINLMEDSKLYLASERTQEVIAELLELKLNLEKFTKSLKVNNNE